MSKDSDYLYGLKPLEYKLPNFDALELRDPAEEAAQMFMQGLRNQVRLAELGLGQDQQVEMYCWHGHEKLQVLRISMPSHTVVAMHCIDHEDCQVDVTGHIHSITFSIKVRTLVPPAIRHPIGFEMPSSTT